VTRRNQLVGSIILIIIALLTYSLYPKKFEVEREYKSIFYSFDTDFEQETIIKMSGDWYKKPFGKDTIIGTLTVDKDHTYPFKLEYDGQKYFFLITENEQSKLKSIGTITVSRNLDKVWLMLKDINEKYGIDGYVFGPADNKEEANESIRQMMDFEKNS
jgi:hypothetical protein